MDNDQSPLADTEVHYLRSGHVGEEFKIFVGHCGRERHAPTGVLYLTDANGLFGGTVDLIRSMQLDAHLPPLLVVGIGYRAGILAETMAARTRDLTPTSDPGFAGVFPDQSAMGGAPALLAFIRSELMPWVASTYGTDPTDATYFGHSFGGLFGAYVLLTEPDTFGRYLLGSPSLWWDREWIFRHEGAWAATHDDLRADVFVAVGSEETHEGRQREAVNLSRERRAQAGLRHIDMVDDADRLVATLRGRRYPSLTVTSEVLADEFHVTVPLLSLSRGLRHLYHAPR